MKIFFKIAIVGAMFGLMVGCASANESNIQTPAPTLSVVQTQMPSDDGHDQLHNHNHEVPRAVGTKGDFDQWLIDNPWHKSQIAQYEQFLVNKLGKHAVPPLHQLLTSARSWQECGFEPYQIPPTELWDNMLPTLKLYAKLRQLGILPPNTEIRSVYRNPELNRCAGGAVGSKHLTNGAIDIWVPTYHKDSYQMKTLQNRLCQFWIDSGQNYNVGLGIYATGAIHLDTQGYRKWGGEYSEYGSPCRYIVPKPDITISITQRPLPVISAPTLIPQNPSGSSTGAPLPNNNPTGGQSINYFNPNDPTNSGQQINYFNPDVEIPSVPNLTPNHGNIKIGN